MGCFDSKEVARPGTVWRCQYCSVTFPTYEKADRHEKFQCTANPAKRQAFQSSSGGGGQRQRSEPQAQQVPIHLRCGGCGTVFGVPPGHAQVRCPKCNIVNAVPLQPKASIPLQPYQQQPVAYNATTVSQVGPPPSGRKKALLVGINYFGTRAELRGCINDVRRMSGLLTAMYGFPSGPNNMRILTDDQSNPQATPTRANIVRALQWLAQGAAPGDVLFFHYSGHGAQQEDPTYMEEDGYDETICPCDFQSAGMIVDSEIFDLIVAPLPAGVKLTAVMDCCHSGTGLDLPFTWERRWIEEENPCHSQCDAILISGCQDDQTSSDGGGGYGRPAGAMTTALCNTLERNPVLTHDQLLQELRRELRRGGFDQIPSLTSSQRFDVSSKLFSPVDGIEGNSNPQLGRLLRKKKHPKRANLLSGGLGEMLMAGAVGFIAADLAGDVLGQGLMMGGGAADMVGGGLFGGLLGGGAAGLFGGGGYDMFGGGDGDGDGDW